MTVSDIVRRPNHVKGSPYQRPRHQLPLTWPNAQLAGVPSYDVGGASAYVRSFYRARSRIATTSDRLWGAGVYALNAHARRKFTNFPTVIADDLFVDGQFTPRQKTILETDPVIVSTPRTIRTLISILRRTYRGNSELAASNLLAVSPNPTSGTLAELLRNSRRPSELLDSAVYIASVIFARREPPRPGSTVRHGFAVLREIGVPLGIPSVTGIGYTP